MASTIYNGRVRLRKMVHGYQMAHSVRTATDSFMATIEKTAPATWHISVQNSAKAVVSEDTAATLALAKDQLLRQLTDLGVKFAVKQPQTSVVASPVFSPVAGSYGPTQSVVITSSTSGSSIYYTTNGSTPTTSSTLYTGPVTVSSSLTIKAIAVKLGHISSSVMSSAYVINGAVATPTFSPVAGSYVGTQVVTISSATSGAALHYTVDGSTPTSTSPLYTAPISVAVSETVKVLGVKANFSNSAVASAAYVIS